ncbi:hypothetical protein BS47DRAFT_1338909 [Hydnum rufescens UP504]|uniref:Mitochondrial import inner membrane translocase subunit TIM44 n=1 Tax=Hydnum rufescens UP504 TaxID=1448309 RepID=A0A9P6E0M4_9AGAM|nr:hypothetical protein BS47DRAFT_1338909 [Hydnum rufescens UP504]
MYCVLPATRLAGRRIITRSRPRRSILSPIPSSNPTLSDLRSSSFHTSSYRQNDQPKSPYQTFIDTLQEEIRKNRRFQEDLLQLKGDVDKLQDSEALKRARDVYERARLTSSIKENPRLRAAAEELRKQGIKIGDVVSDALKTMEESDIMRAISRASSAVSSTIASTTEPIRNTAAYKALSETVLDALDDSGSSRHGGYEAKEARRKRREKRLAKAGKAAGRVQRTEANPEAGERLVLHKDAAKNEKWDRLKQTNPILRQFTNLRRAYDESENPFVSGVRSVTDTIGTLFDENETAQATRILRAMDPTFDVEGFHRELREYIIPEVVDAYLSADREALQAWCGEATYNVLWATMEQYLKQGLLPESEVLDIRHVDVSSGKILEGNLPVFEVSFSTQEVLMFRNALTREVVVGAPDRVEQCRYAAILTRDEGELRNELTAGWKVIEMARRSARSYL